MAKVPTPKAISTKDLGPGRQSTSTKGAFGGGTAYRQMKPPTSFAMPTVKGHSQKVNVKPVIDNQK